MKTRTEYNRQLRERWRARGLCIRCGKNSIEVNSMCGTCRGYNNQTAKVRREQGICTRCGVNKPQEGRRMCEGCLEMARKENGERRQRYIKQGLCALDGKRPVVLGKTMCKEHLAHYVQLCNDRREQRINNGLCIDCGKNPKRKYSQRCFDCYPLKVESKEAKEQRIAQEQGQKKLVYAGLIEEVKAKMPLMKEKEKTAVRFRFGVDDGTQRTLEQVGILMGLTRERVRQLVRNGMSRTVPAPHKRSAKFI